MYLSRLILNPRSRAVRRDLADCQALHRRVMAGFPDLPDKSARAHFGVLYRLDVHPRTATPTLLVQSREAPDWSSLEAGYLEVRGDGSNPSCKSIAETYDALQDGMALVFRLRANPTRRIGKSESDGSRWKGKRVELRNDAARLDWLVRKAVQGGFELLAVRTQHRASAVQPISDVRSNEEAKVAGRRPALNSGGARLAFGSALFEGRLRVTDAALFRQTLEHGIGSGKAYGFGLLSIARDAG